MSNVNAGDKHHYNFLSNLKEHFLIDFFSNLSIPHVDCF